MNLSKFTKPELEFLRENLNLTEDEEQVFTMLTKGKSRVQISLETCLSVRSVDYRIHAIKKKISRLKEVIL